MLERLSKMGFDVSSLDLTVPTQKIVETARVQVEEGRVKADFPELRKQLYSILDGFEAESARNAKLFPGTREALEALRIRQARLAVVTNSGRRAATDVLGRYGLEGYFEFVLTRDEVDAMKPDPEGLAKAVSMLRLPLAAILYVGDSVFDIMAAKKAGLKVVSVATGNYTVEKLKSEGADFVLSSLSELPGLLSVYR